MKPGKARFGAPTGNGGALYLPKMTWARVAPRWATERQRVER